MLYNRVTEDIIHELIVIAGGRNVLLDPAKLEAYSHDETSKEEYAHMPDVVVTPESTEVVAAIVKLANRAHIPLTDRKSVV